MKARKKVLEKMVKDNLCTQLECDNGKVSEDRVQMYISGVELVEAKPTIEAQLKAREFYAESLIGPGKKSNDRNIKKLLKAQSKIELRKETRSVSFNRQATAGETQIKEVEAHLEEFGSITSLDAIKEYGITRLSHVIYMLRKDGKSITTENVTKTNRRGHLVTFAKYILNEGRVQENEGKPSDKKES